MDALFQHQECLTFRQAIGIRTSEVMFLVVMHIVQHTVCCRLAYVPWMRLTTQCRGSRGIRYKTLQPNTPDAQEADSNMWQKFPNRRIEYPSITNVNSL